MAKRGRPKGSGKKVIGSIPRAKKASAKPNGQEAIKAAEREMPQGEEAVKALKVLADLNDAVKVLEANEAVAKDEYQEAKAAREAAQKELGEKLWQLTHKPNLPLFDPKQAEADLQQIQEAASAPPAESVLEGGAAAATVPPLALPASDGAQDTLQDDQPF